ncbi:velvet factor [Leucosporidium creatinivorum]|uniref:Velvet factor n=1 Tax=Leucosporidium creatinivorum TaxID=106004 RepID=A0A1Y2FQA3_9BASI|nr:velvet factor [Leucosporidium creatinivorum]
MEHPQGMVELLASLAPQLDCTFVLEIVQQPVRARMCGLGDRDRRPITPPLIAKLVCKDPRTGEPLPVEDLDTSFLIVAADLRTPELEDANIVRTTPSWDSHHTSTAPSTAASSCASSIRSPSLDPSPRFAERHLSPQFSEQSSAPPSPRKRSRDEPTLPTPPTTVDLEAGEFSPPSGSTHCAPLPPTSPPIPQSPNRPPSPKQSPIISYVKHESLDSTSAPSFKRRRTSEASAESAAFVPYANDARVQHHLALEHPPPIPNLIGALHTNAFKLNDEDGEAGIFFVLPDLSVRTEGSFRLRLRLLSIGHQGSRTDGGTAVVASTDSQPFVVSSAKKFEGMMDPTSLSKCFAKQGVRIPTRKVARGSKGKESNGGSPEGQ